MEKSIVIDSLMALCLFNSINNWLSHAGFDPESAQSCTPKALNFLYQISSNIDQFT